MFADPDGDASAAPVHPAGSTAHSASVTFQMESNRFPRGGCDQVDHGDEGGGVSVSASPCPGGLEEAVQALHAGVAMG